MSGDTLAGVLFLAGVMTLLGLDAAVRRLKRRLALWRADRMLVRGAEQLLIHHAPREDR